MPRGMMVTLWTGSACATVAATKAWPISWWATMSRSFSDSTRLFFSSPATMRSMASSKSDISTAFFSFRAASSAASFTMLARSAPAKPGVRAAMTPSSTLGASTTARACSLRMASRQERLAGAGRPHRQHALGDAAAEALVLARVLEEVDDLDQLGLGLVHAGHVGEGRLQLLAVEALVLAAPEGERLRGPAADAAHEEHPDRDHHRERDDPAEEQVLPEGRLDAPGELHVVRAQLVDELLVVHERDARRHEDAGLLLAAQQLAEPIAGGARGRGQGTRLGDPADF